MEPTAGAQAAVKERKRHPLLVDLVIRLVKTKPLATVGGVLILLLFLTAIFADVLAPYGYNETDMAARLTAPSAKHLFGVDNVGRDLLSRVVFGARISILVGFLATSISVTIGSTIGIVSGYLGGKVDLIIQRFVDAWMCLPTLFMILTVMSILGPGLWQVIFALGVLMGIGRSRIVRSAVIGIKENVYVEASRAVGVPTGRILTRHILPNVTAPIIILLTINIGQAILMEATLSFLGFGIPPPMPSWGGMLSGAGRRYMLLAPWLAFWPGLALSLTVWGINMLGDGVRDLLDPRLRGGLGRYGGVGQEISKAKTRVTRGAA